VPSWHTTRHSCHRGSGGGFVATIGFSRANLRRFLGLKYSVFPFLPFTSVAMRAKPTSLRGLSARDGRDCGGNHGRATAHPANKAWFKEAF